MKKCTCLRFTQLIAAANKRKMRELRALKRLMLEFRAYGTVDSANISRWHNVKQIYHAVMETNRIPEAVEDITNKLNILVEHQRELEDARNNTVAWVLTLFGIVSILASILSIIQDSFSGGDPLRIRHHMSTLVITVLVACHPGNPSASGENELSLFFCRQPPDGRFFSSRRKGDWSNQQSHSQCRRVDTPAS